MRIKNLNLVNTVTAYLFPINREKTNHSKNNALLSLELSESSHSEQRWRLLQYFCIYRLLIGCTLILIAWNFNQASFSVYRYMPFIYTVAGYILFSCLCIALTRFRFSTLDWQLFSKFVAIFFFCVYALHQRWNTKWIRRFSINLSRCRRIDWSRTNGTVFHRSRL